jgi:CubicO group peptidase (beta-lactamase class C family)
MKLRHIACVFTILSAVVPFDPAQAEDSFPGVEWERVIPTELGWSEAKLTQARAFSEQFAGSAVVVVQHGKIVAEWGDTTKRMELASVRKSLLSALIGIAVSENLINLDSTLGELGIDDNPPSLTDVEKAATVRQLLEARSGVYHPTLHETPEMARARPPRGSHPPGTFWYYNNWDFNALGTIYEHATGTGIFEALYRKIAKPIGMQDYRPQDGEYFRGDASIHPAYPIRMSARDLARFAVLYLHKGNWAGHQIVPRDWVDESTRAHSKSAFGPGYGYLWWTDFIDDVLAHAVSLPKGSFFALGDGGQYAVVMPALDLVVVQRGDRDVNRVGPSMRDVGRLLWLVLKAEGYDPGPDASITSASGAKPKDEDVRTAFLSRTISYGAALRQGPCTLRFEPGGQITYLHLDPRCGPATGTWMVSEGQLCISNVERRCFFPVVNGDRIELFDRYGVMQIDAIVLPQ